MAAVEVCSSDASCPKISFSHDLSDIVPVEQLPRQSLSSTVDFTFFALNRFDFIPADELFSDGKILPFAGTKQPPRPQSDCPKHTVTGRIDNTTPFRVGTKCGRFCNFRILGRSNSTGSTRDSERVAGRSQRPLSKSKSQSHRQQSVAGYAKPPLKKKKNREDSVLKIPVTNLCGFGSLCFSGKDRVKKNR